MKKLLATIMALVMALSLLPTAWADGDGAAAGKAVAKIGTAEYTTLADAVEAAKAGDTITLTYDVTLDSKLTINKAITLDGAGHTIAIGTTTDYSCDFELGASSAGTTIQNVVFDVSKMTAAQSAAIYFGYNFSGEGTTTVKDCTFLGVANSSGIGIESTYNLAVKNLKIENCTFDTLKYGVYLNAASNVAFSGNTFKDIRYNAVNVAGDVEKYPCKDISFADNTLTNCSTGNYDVDVYSAGLSFGEHTSGVTITSGSISMANGKLAVYSADKSNVSVTGGTFSSDPSDFVADGYVANGTNGTWTVTKFASGETKTTTTTENGTTKTTVEDVNIPTNAKTNVTIDASKATTVTINADAVKKLNEGSAKVEKVEVVTSEATLTIDQQALATLLTNPSKPLVLTVSKTGNTTTEKTFKLTAQVDGKDVFTNSKGTITVTVPMAAPGFRQQHVCYYVADDGAKTRMGGAGYKDSTFSWDTNHFSTFVVVTETVSTNREYIDLNGSSSGTTTTTTTTTTGKAASAKTFDAGVGIYAVSAILSVTGMAWVGKKKH